MPSREAPDQYELQELIEVMEDAGQSDQTIENVLQFAALKRDRFEKYKAHFARIAAQHANEPFCSV